MCLKCLSVCVYLSCSFFLLWLEHSYITVCAVYRMDLACDMALSAVKTVAVEKTGGLMEIDIKRYARVEKIPGGIIEDSEVLQGVMINKDVTHPRMHRLDRAFLNSTC